MYSLGFTIRCNIVRDPCFLLIFNSFNCSKTRKYVYVVVNFLSQVIFIFLLFLGMVIYANEFETMEKQKIT